MNIHTLPCDFANPADPTGKLVVVLHGRGDSAAGFHWMPTAMGLPGVAYLLVNAPDEWMGGRSWYSLPPDHMAGVLRSRQLLDALFAEVFAQGYTPQDTVLFGFSQGCLMTLEWGGRTQIPLAGFCGVSGYVADAMVLQDELSDAAVDSKWLVTHGRQDEVLDFENTEAQIGLLQMAGLPVVFKAYDKTHTIDADLGDIRAFLIDALGL